MILPPATLGVLGGGQLGRMFTAAALTMGYKVIVLDPDPDSPAGRIASEHLRAAYTDPAALARLGAVCAAVTIEFENIDADSLRALAQKCIVRPGGDAVAVLQDRGREKTFLRDHGFPTAPFAIARRSADLPAALEITGCPALLKISRLGYDGKGQVRVSSLEEARAAFIRLGGVSCVAERLLPLETELAVVLARDSGGTAICYPASENLHRNGILDLSIVPARVPAEIALQAQEIAAAIAGRLDYCGVLAVEFFLLAGNRLVVNEAAPRPHNSGHYTLDACLTDQFEQQVRMLCGLPPGDARLLSPVVMVNLLGDLWGDGAGSRPAWEELLKYPQLKLHLYGKSSARPGRKMGHFNCAAPTSGQALALALEARQALLAAGRRA